MTPTPEKNKIYPWYPRFMARKPRYVCTSLVLFPSPAVLIAVSVTTTIIFILKTSNEFKTINAYRENFLHDYQSQQNRHSGTRVRERCLNSKTTSFAKVKAKIAESANAKINRLKPAMLFRKNIKIHTFGRDFKIRKKSLKMVTSFSARRSES